MKSEMWTREFWLATLERAIKACAQTAVAVIGAGQLGLFDVPWWAVASTAGLGSVMSVLTSIGSAGLRSGGKGDPALFGPERVVEADQKIVAAR